MLMRCIVISKKSIIIIFWFLGFAFGFGIYLFFPKIINWLQYHGLGYLNDSLLGAIVFGLICSFITTIAIVTKYVNRNNL